MTGAAPFSPGWTALSAPLPLSPEFTAHTRRISDADLGYADAGEDDEDEGANGRGASEDGHDGAGEAGLLVECLRSAASTRPIVAERDEAQ